MNQYSFIQAVHRWPFLPSDASAHFRHATAVRLRKSWCAHPRTAGCAHGQNSPNVTPNSEVRNPVRDSTTQGNNCQRLPHNTPAPAPNNRFTGVPNYRPPTHMPSSTSTTVLAHLLQHILPLGTASLPSISGSEPACFLLGHKQSVLDPRSWPCTPSGYPLTTAQCCDLHTLSTLNISIFISSASLLSVSYCGSCCCTLLALHHCCHSTELPTHHL